MSERPRLQPAKDSLDTMDRMSLPSSPLAMILSILSNVSVASRLRARPSSQGAKPQGQPTRRGHAHFPGAGQGQGPLDPHEDEEGDGHEPR